MFEYLVLRDELERLTRHKPPDKQFILISSVEAERSHVLKYFLLICDKILPTHGKSHKDVVTKSMIPVKENLLKYY